VSAHNHRLGLARDWQRLLPGLAVVTTPGNHESYLRDMPDASAAALAECIAALESQLPTREATP